ncbi:MAG: 50S ribosomal protein L18e [Nanoarchaeota archaeon]
MHAKKSNISITHIKRKAVKKTNPILSATILAARKQKNWVKIAHKLSGSSRAFSSINLTKIDSETKAGDTVIILGKVLSSGSLSKKIRIVALNISVSAKEKIKSSKSEFVTILEEINKNPKAEGIRVIE